MFDLRGRVAVITGASSGLGMQMAKAFASYGADLVIIARRIDILEKLKKKKEKNNVRVLTSDIKYAAELSEKEFGKVDILINCAGASLGMGVNNTNDEDWDITVNTDLTSIFKMTREFSKIMIKNNYGRIINISSIYGLVGNSKIPAIAYHSSKGGVINFTRAAASELAKYNITVNAICPGYFYTELTKDVLNTESFKDYIENHVPMKRYGKEGELNAGAIFLASSEASYVTGVILPIDGGYTCV